MYTGIQENILSLSV